MQPNSDDTEIKHLYRQMRTDLKSKRSLLAPNFGSMNFERVYKIFFHSYLKCLGKYRSACPKTDNRPECSVHTVFRYTCGFQTRSRPFHRTIFWWRRSHWGVWSAPSGSTGSALDPSRLKVGHGQTHSLRPTAGRGLPGYRSKPLNIITVKCINLKYSKMSGLSVSWVLLWSWWI